MKNEIIYEIEPTDISNNFILMRAKSYYNN